MGEIIVHIALLCKSYLDYVELMGNECAFTDSIVENIIKKSSELKEKYDEGFDYVRQEN